MLSSRPAESVLHICPMVWTVTSSSGITRACNLLIYGLPTDEQQPTLTPRIENTIVCAQALLSE